MWQIENATKAPHRKAKIGHEIGMASWITHKIIHSINSTRSAEPSPFIIRFLSLPGILSATGNGYVLYMTIKRKTKLKPPELMTLNLAIFDFGISGIFHLLSEHQKSKNNRLRIIQTIWGAGLIDAFDQPHAQELNTNCEALTPWGKMFSTRSLCGALWLTTAHPRFREIAFHRETNCDNHQNVPVLFLDCYLGMSWVGPYDQGWAMSSAPQCSWAPQIEYCVPVQVRVPWEKSTGR